MALDRKLAEKAQEELDKKSSGSGLFIRLKEGEEKDIKVIDPTPSMNGIWYLEVPVWWVDKKRIPSPELVGESDSVQRILDQIKEEFRADGSIKDYEKLLNAANSWGGKKVKKDTEYWTVVLEFEWNFDKNEEIEGIYDAEGNVDAELVDKYIVDQKAKILAMKISLTTEINKIATSRGGYMLSDQADGFNLLVSRKGKNRDTKYSAVKTDPMPVPEKYYDLNKSGIDPVKIAKGQLFNDAYIEQILVNYFYGDKLEDPGDGDYLYPELRSKDSEESAPEESSRRRRKTTEDEPEQASSRRRAAEPEEEEEKPKRRRAAKEEESAPRRASAGSSKRRNLVDDVDDA